MRSIDSRRARETPVVALVAFFLALVGEALADEEKTTDSKRPVQIGRALIVANRTEPQAELEQNGSILGAQLVAAALNQVGLASVTSTTDLTASELRRLLVERQKAPAEDSWSLFHYGGHAVHWRGENYLLASDFPYGEKAPKDEAAISAALKAHAVALKEVIRSAPAHSRPNVVIIDACRNNPFPQDGALGRSWSSGLEEEDEPFPHSLIAFSAAPTLVASDPWQAPSLYTSALAGLLKLPGARLLSVFPELTHIMRFSAQWPVFTSYVGAEDDVLLREPATLTVRAAANDDAVLLRNEKLVGMAGQQQPFSVVLDPGENVFRLLVYNQKSFTGGFELFGGYQREGWSVGLSLTEPGQAEPLVRIHESEPTPADESRHGRLFDVATFVIHLDPWTGRITQTGGVQNLWRGIP
ncbi:caspase family protein [Stigmatella sp. ncwal1]|uniref:Caspase family protein n=1 Tax=Stigmatella ashevillensis TaxID=2995309 RepID=A0ABT5DCM7_9BACT|nr:caspase family protein [Stigmatella ashevillena]MDC0711432.1 caspase family protein [Stigmatella ashevillena]